MIKNCWDAIGAADCEFGAHLFDGSAAKIYVHYGLDVGLEMSHLFGRKSDEGYAGHCLLVFCGIKTFDFVINPYEINNGKPEWKDPIAKRYIGDIRDGVKTYNLGGGIHGFQAYVSIEIEARDFDLHLLEESDPAWRS